jgi:hypothetical protein
MCGALEHDKSSHLYAVSKRALIETNCESPCGGLSYEQEYRFNDKYMCEITETYKCAPPCPIWKGISWATWQSKDKTTLLQKGVTTSGCHLGACNPINFTILNPEDPKWKNDQQIAIYIYGGAKTWGLYCSLKELQILIKPGPTRFFTPSMKKWKDLCPPSSLLPEICF